MTTYIVPFLISFLLTVILIAAGIFLGRRIHWRGRASDRHVHRRGVLRVGGAAMVIAFNLAIFLDPHLVITPPLYGMMAASLILLAVGLWDDIKEVFWKIQFFFQAAAVILAFVLGVRIYYVTNFSTGGLISLDSGLGIILSIGLVMAWSILMINSMNWIDGIDGLSGGVTIIGALTIFFLSLKPEVNQPPMAILSMILAGAALGFLIFNFHPSFVLAGTAGSTFMGFALATLAIFAGTKIATSILVMSLPLIDFLWVIGERIRRKRSIFKPDKNHLHHKLMVLGWSQRKTALYFYVVTAIISLVALNTRAIGKAITLAAAVAIMAAALIFINKKISKKGAALAESSGSEK